MEKELLKERKKTIYDFICDEFYVPMKVKEMAIVLNVPKSQRSELQEVLDVLGKDKYIRQVYGTTGNCRLHCQGYAPNNQTLDAHVRYLYNHNEGIRRLEWHMLVTTYKDVDGGVEYDREVLCDF